jgi:hypothetical protein
MPHRPWLRAAVGLLACIIGLHLSAIGARAQSADTILVNGKIVSGDAAAPVRGAIAIADGKILALGDDAETRRFAGPRTQVVDLGGRTVIPGLIDSHIHGIRAALSFATEVSWIDAASLTEALERIRAAAKAAKPGAWLIVSSPNGAGPLRLSSPLPRLTIPSTFNFIIGGRCSRRWPCGLLTSPATPIFPRVQSSNATPTAIRPAASPVASANSARSSPNCRRRATPTRSPAPGSSFVR